MKYFNDDDDNISNISFCITG